MDESVTNAVLNFGMGGAFIAFLILQSRNTQIRLDAKDVLITALQDKRVADMERIAVVMQQALASNTAAFAAQALTQTALKEAIDKLVAAENANHPKIIHPSTQG